MNPNRTANREPATSIVNADDDSLISASEPPPLTRTPPPSATRLDAAAVVLAGLILPRDPDRSCRCRCGSPPFSCRSIPLLLGAVALVVVRPASGVSRHDGVGHVCGLARTPGPAAGRGRGASRVRGDASARCSSSRYFAVVTFGLAPTASRILSRRSARQPAGAVRRRLVRRHRARRLQWDPSSRGRRTSRSFPALPMLMRPVGAAASACAHRALPRDERMLRALWAGVFISLAAFFWALVYLSRLSRLLAGRRRAAMRAAAARRLSLRRVLQRAVHGGAVPARRGRRLLSLHREQWVAASLFGLLVGLSRPNGCFVSVPLAMLALRRRCTAVDGRVAAARRWRRWLRPAAVRLLVAAMPGIAMLVFTAYLYWLTGVWFAWARIHEAWGRTWGTRPLAQGWEWLTTEGLMMVSQGVPFDTLNTLARAVRPRAALAGLPAARRRLWRVRAHEPVPPLFAGGALSMGRITSTLFPLFIALAALLPRQAVPAWVAGFRDPPGARGRAVLHLARAVLTIRRPSAAGRTAG